MKKAQYVVKCLQYNVINMFTALYGMGVKNVWNTEHSMQSKYTKVLFLWGKQSKLCNHKECKKAKNVKRQRMLVAKYHKLKKI